MKHLGKVQGAVAFVVLVGFFGCIWLVVEREVSGFMRDALLILIGNAITPGKGYREGPFVSQAELRELLGHDATLSPSDALRLATVNGARALGLAGRRGELRTGTQADLIAIPFSGSLGDAAAGVIAHEGRVAASLIAGDWAIAPSSS